MMLIMPCIISHLSTLRYDGNLYKICKEEQKKKKNNSVEIYKMYYNRRTRGRARGRVVPRGIVGLKITLLQTKCFKNYSN